MAAVGFPSHRMTSKVSEMAVSPCTTLVTAVQSPSPACRRRAQTPQNSSFSSSSASPITAPIS